MRRSLANWLALPMLLLAAVASAQTPLEIEAGYRFLDVSGNKDVYRTQINERDGLTLRSLSFSSSAPAAGLDFFRIDANDLGAAPAGIFRIDAGKRDLYRVRVSYRSAERFSALPEYANPLFDKGVTISQHTYDRDRQTFDADVELLPGRRITPFLGYSYSKFSGPGTTTYHVGQDEFALVSNLDEREDEFRGGAGFNFGNIYGQVTQGWRNVKSREDMAVALGNGNGNNPEPVLDRPVSLNNLHRTDKDDISTPFTNLFVTGEFLKRVRVTGNYVRFAAENDSTESETLNGSLVSFPLRRYYNGLSEQVTATAKNTTWRGGARAEVSVIDNVDVFGGWQRDHRELGGSALINSLYLQSITFGGIDQRDLTEVMNATSSIERQEDTLNVGVAARAIGPFSLRAEYRVADQDVDVAPDLSEIVVDGAQGGSVSRKIDTYELTGNYAAHGLLLGASYRHDKADDPVFRTDFLGRDRTRLRASYKLSDKFRIGGTAEETKQDNDRVGTGYEANVRQFSTDVEVAPVTMLRLRGSVSKYKADSTILIRRPQNFTEVLSQHEENGKGYEGGFALLLDPISIDAGFMRFDNEGSIPFKLDRVSARVTYDFLKHTGLAAEYAQDKYNEEETAIAGYNARRFGIFVRWHQ